MFFNSLYEGWEINVLYHLLWITSHVICVGSMMALQPFSSHVHHTQALHEETSAKINAIFCSVVFEFYIMNKMVQNRSELWHPLTKRSHRRNRDCVTNPGPTLWMALCEYLEKNRPTSITGMTPAIPPMTHVLKANNVSTNYKAAVSNGSVAWNERSEQSLITVQRDRRWTKQRDTQRGDIIRWGDFSLASSQSGHKAAFGWTHWSEKQGFYLSTVHAHMAHICTHRLTL